MSVETVMVDKQDIHVLNMFPTDVRRLYFEESGVPSGGTAWLPRRPLTHWDITDVIKQHGVKLVRCIFCDDAQLAAYFGCEEFYDECVITNNALLWRGNVYDKMKQHGIKHWAHFGDWLSDNSVTVVVISR